MRSEPANAIFRLTPCQRLILASQSPRRRALLASIGLVFDMLPCHCLEPAAYAGESGAAYAARMACLKASSLPPQIDAAVITADTVVCLNDHILGKPIDELDALRMLRMLNGKTHAVCTGVHISLPNGATRAFVETTRVTFGLWPDAALAAYAATGEPLDKAGAYAIQGLGAFLIESIAGSYTNVVGLPLEKLMKALLAEGVAKT